ncbi:MAG: DUF559 domain-containing protein [Myxococcota bacterium]
MSESADFTAVLQAHQLRRQRGDRLVTTLAGDYPSIRALWGQWCRATERRQLIAAAPTLDAARSGLEFARQRAGGAPRVALLFLRDAEDTAVPVQAADRFSRQYPRIPTALALTSEELRAVLSSEHAAWATTVTEALLTLNIRTEAPEEPTDKYRSIYEEMLHRLLVAHPDINAKFEVNVRVRGASLHPYEIDLFCRRWRLAVEVDGSQHMTNPKQKARDKERDNDLGAAGVETLRIVAERTLSHPTECLGAVQHMLSMRQKEMSS